MSKPQIQIDDVTREMTDEEHAAYLVILATIPPVLEAPDDTPSPA